MYKDINVLKWKHRKSTHAWKDRSTARSSGHQDRTREQSDTDSDPNTPRVFPVPDPSDTTSILHQTCSAVQTKDHRVRGTWEEKGCRLRRLVHGSSGNTELASTGGRKQPSEVQTYDESNDQKTYSILRTVFSPTM